MEKKDTNNSKLLIKFPTRNRPEKFFQVLDRYYCLMLSPGFEFVVSCDTDDTTMNNEEVIKRLSWYPNLTLHFGDNKSKVEAINNNLEGKIFDILLLASDDMVPEIQGYDAAIKAAMGVWAPDTDGVLWFDDGFQHRNLNTLVVMGKKYYDRFGYIYHPDYQSLYCDLEFTQVSKKLNKVVYINECIIRHQQYSITGEEPDALYIKNDALQAADQETYKKREAAGFPP